MSEAALAFLQVMHALFHRVSGDDLVDIHVMRLADAMCPACCLILRRGIPPWVSVHHHGGTNEVESRIARLQGVPALSKLLLMMSRNMVNCENTSTRLPESMAVLTMSTMASSLADDAGALL